MEQKEWLDGFIQKYGHDPSGGAIIVYGGVRVWAEAVRQVGDVTNYDAINEWIATQPYEHFPGAGEFSFDEDNKLNPKQAKMLMGQCQGGRIPLSHGKVTKCSSCG
jgi:hypothetical protein